MPTFGQAVLVVIASMFSSIIFIKSCNFMIPNQIMPLISIIIGIATSCLLLSLILLIQRKETNELIASANITSTTENNDITPNMNPRASVASIGLNQDSRSTSTRFDSSEEDKPPNYEDALIYSKPINWFDYYSEKKPFVEDSILSSSSNKQDDLISFINMNQNMHKIIINNNFRCSKHMNEFVNINQPIHIVSSKDCNICTNLMISESLQNQYKTNLNINKENNINNDDHQPSISGNRMADLALNIVRGFTSNNLENSTNQQQHDNYRNDLIEETDRRVRKASFCQLDVNQLMLLSNSPPEYHNLSFNGDNIEQAGSTSNEPRAGGRQIN